jgi:hypothetical protein
MEDQVNLDELAVIALTERVQRLEKALYASIPWIGVSKHGPSWATDDAKERNRAMCDQAELAALDALAPTGGDQ